MDSERKKRTKKIESKKKEDMMSAKAKSKLTSSVRRRRRHGTKLSSRGENVSEKEPPARHCRKKREHAEGGLYIQRDVILTGKARERREGTIYRRKNFSRTNISGAQIKRERKKGES